MLLLLAACLWGCAEAVTLEDLDRQTGTSMTFIAGNAWRSAQRSYRVAVHHARRSAADPGTIAVLDVQYGRASGVICAWAEAEAAFQEAYVLYKRYDGPYWKILLELARMSMARQEYRVASSYMQELLPLLENTGYRSFDPVGYAHILEDNALIAEKLMWDEDAVLRYTGRAAAIHAAYPGKPPLFARTPYGTECVAVPLRPEKPAALSSNPCASGCP